jgi:hypothetical protein
VVNGTPDQSVFGGQLSLREFAPAGSFSPNLEVGFGVTSLQNLKIMGGFDFIL